MILSGDLVKEQHIGQLKKEIDSLVKKPKLVIVTVGNDMASNVYVKHKIKLANEVGMIAEHLVFDDECSQTVLLDQISLMNDDSDIHGILVQLPLPDKFDKLKVLNSVCPKKDVDGFSYQNIAHEFLGDNKGLTACTVAGIFDLLEYYEIDLMGKNVVVVGKSEIVGKPLVLKLINASATVISCNSKTDNIKQFIDTADIFISAIGSPKFFDAKYFVDCKPSLVVVDVGINRDQVGNLCGDVDSIALDSAKISYSPVPKGVGPLTVLNVIKNVLIAYKRNGGSSFTE